MQRLWRALAVFLLAAGLGAPAQAAQTRLCNASAETLYVTVRHYAQSLLRPNARTEGWTRLPTRGITRSCWVLNRTLRDHIVVVGVLRGDKVVPIKMTPRRYRRSAQPNVCVQWGPRFFEYTSSAWSDASCGTSARLAAASFSVEGGKNDVDIDLSGPIQVPGGGTAGSSQGELDKTLETMREVTRALLSDGLVKNIDLLRLESFASSHTRDGKERIARWTGYLVNKVLSTSVDTKGANAGGATFHWLKPGGALVRVGTTSGPDRETYSERFFQKHTELKPFLTGRNLWSVEMLWDVPMLCLHADSEAKPQPGGIKCHQLTWHADEAHRFGGRVALYGYWIFRVKEKRIKPDTPIGFPFRVYDAVVDQRQP